MIERILKSVAPHQCLVCGEVGRIICGDCELDVSSEMPSVCYRCNALTKQMRTCRSCRSSSDLFSLHTAAEYDSTAKALVLAAKFKSTREAARIMAESIDSCLPSYVFDVVVPVPTVSRRVRQRGYDHALFIARRVAKLRGVRCVQPLVRTSLTHQIGADIKTRRQQLRGAIRMRSIDLARKSILLVDDVVSTGASLEASAEMLKRAGAKRIYGAVFARNV